MMSSLVTGRVATELNPRLFESSESGDHGRHIELKTLTTENNCLVDEFLDVAIVIGTELIRGLFATVNKSS